MSETARLVWVTPEAEKQIMYCARVSNPNNQDSTNTGLLKYCMKHGHWSIFEMANMCVEINTSRTIARQILRHRSFSYQEFCITGDSKITCLTKNRSKKRTIKSLYDLQNDKRWNREVRVFDETTKTLVSAKVKEVFKTGLKPVYEIVLENGKKIKSTKDHKFYTKKGFKKLEDIKVGSFVGCNGMPVYQSRSWLKEQKNKVIQNGTGVQGIADAAGCSYHTIRKWLKIHNLSFTKQEVAEYTTIWNKGLPKEQQPMYGKFHSVESRKKMYDSSRKGKDSNLFSTGGNKDRPWSNKVRDWSRKQYQHIVNNEGENCTYCGATTNLEVDHIVPVAENPKLALEFDNLQLLCKSCHREKSSKENAKLRQTVTWSKVVSITYVGEEMTYDMEIDHVDHNYIANGIITHNSQRYANITELQQKNQIIYSDARSQDQTNRQNSNDDMDKETKDWFKKVQEINYNYSMSIYEQAIEKGIAKECARVVLPEGQTQSRMYMNGTIRSWLHFLQLRTGNGTQKECQDVANEIKKIFKKELPILGELL